MDATLTAIVSMGFAVALSPETFLPGMWIAGLKENALKKAWCYFAGGALGISLFLALGFFLDFTVPSEPSWTRFIIRLVLGTALILLGVYVLLKKRAVNAQQKYERYEHRVSLRVALGLGFLVTGLNIKVMSLSIAAGHQISASQDSMGMQIAELSTFFAIGVIPLILPALVDTVRRGTTGLIREPCDRLLEKYGKWIVSAILLVFGVMSFKKALSIMP